MHAFVNCRLDICHYYTLANLIQKLQRVQNCAARLIIKGRVCDHVTTILRELHWLPVNERIMFKLYSSILHVAPLYIYNTKSHNTTIMALANTY